MHYDEEKRFASISDKIFSKNEKFSSKLDHDANCKNIGTKKIISIGDVDHDELSKDATKDYKIIVAHHYVDHKRKKDKFTGMLPIKICTSGCSLDVDFKYLNSDGSGFYDTAVKQYNKEDYYFRTPSNLFSYCNVDFKSISNVYPVPEDDYSNTLKNFSLSNGESNEHRNIRLADPNSYIALPGSSAMEAQVFCTEGTVRARPFVIKNHYDFNSYELKLDNPKSDCLILYNLDKISDYQAMKILRYKIKEIVGLFTKSYVKLGVYKIKFCVECCGKDPISINRPIKVEQINCEPFFIGSYLDIFYYLDEKFPNKFSLKDCELAWRKYQYGH